MGQNIPKHGISMSRLINITRVCKRIYLKDLHKKITKTLRIPRIPNPTQSLQGYSQIRSNMRQGDSLGDIRPDP